MATPLLVLVAVGLVLAWQVQRLSENARWTNHSAAVIAKCFELQKAVVDQETGLRGFLLSGQREFLEPFNSAKPLDRIAELSDEVEDNQDQRVRVAELRRRYELWLDTATSAIEGDRDDAKSVATLRNRKRAMDEIRVAAGSIIQTEQGLRDKRAAELKSSDELTRYALAGLLALAAAAIALVSRRNLGAVAQTFADMLDKERAARAELEE